MIWLAFDIGTTVAKAALVEGESGRILAHTNVSYPSQANFTQSGGISEQDPRAWWEAVVAAARQLDCIKAEGIALTGQMQDVILINSNGDPVRPAILYNDTRAREQADTINAEDGDTLRRVTGNDQDATGLLAKIAWIQAHERVSLDTATHLLLSAADFIAFRLTGVAGTDTTTASTTGLMDIGARTFWGDKTAAIAHLLPALQPGGGYLGELHHEAAERLGARTGIPVHLGPGDAGANTLGIGSGEGSQPYAYIGTSGWVGFTSDHLYASETGVFNLAHPAPDRYFTVAPLLTAGGNLDFVARLFGSTDYAALIGAAADVNVGRLLYLPYLNGERSPFRDPTARGAFIGLEPGHTAAYLTRAVLEGVAFAYRHALEALLPTMPATLTLTGGAAESSTWMQIFADILGLTIQIAADAEFTGVRGAVIAARVARGELRTYAPEGEFATTERFVPDADRAHYDVKYARFRAAYPALKTIF